MLIRLGVVLVATFAIPSGSAAVARPNVLFIAVDDLNHWVGHFDRHPQAHTPSIDRLAAMGVSFTNAHCAAPACNPSRAALMSGLRPNKTGVYTNRHIWQGAIPKEQTLTTQFLNAGYNVFGAGKIYHANAHREGEWTDYFRHPRGKRNRKTPHSSAKNNGVGGIKFKPLMNESVLADEAIVDYGIEKLAEAHERPFFLAVGLHKPHMPWDVPRKYFDLFPLEEIRLPPTQENDLKDIPPAGVKMARPAGDHARMLESGLWKEAVQAYLATIAYADTQIGRLLDALEKSPYKENTIVVLWGDHGWHLGEKEHWRKFALWEEATRAPYIWVVPGVTKPGGVSTRPVDFMSLYPTLCDLCGISPARPVSGVNIRPLLADPAAEWKHPAITTHGRNNHAVRTERYRYIHYADGTDELYDHRSDPYEWTNLAGDPEMAEIKSELAEWIPGENVPGVEKKVKKRRKRGGGDRRRKGRG